MEQSKLPSKNAEVLADFVKFCEENPEYRFWQAIRNWSGSAYILRATPSFEAHFGGLQDTFYLEGK